MKKIMSLIVLVLFVTSLNLSAQPGPENMPAPKEKIIQHLKLTPEQIKKFDELNYNQKNTDIDLHAKIQKNRLELSKIIKDGNIDEKKILALTEENSKIQAEMKSNHIKKWLDVYKMLDKDQKEIWVKTFDKMSEPGFIRERMKERMGEKMKERMLDRKQMQEHKMKMKEDKMKMDKEN